MIRQTPPTECTTRPPCYGMEWNMDAVLVLRLGIRRSDSLEFTAGQSSRFDCRTGPVSTRTEKLLCLPVWL